MTMNDIMQFLRRPASDSDALRSKLAEVAGALPEAEATVARLVAERAAGLLDSSDAALEKIERAEADARRTLDRLRAARDEIARRLSAAEVEEARAALDRDRDEAERQAETTAEKVRTQYVKAARVIAALVTEIDTAERRVAEVNERLAAAGRFDDLVKPVESRAIPEPAEVRPEPFRLAACSLVPAPGFAGLGTARDQAEVAGFVAERIG